MFRIGKEFRFEAAHQLWEGCRSKACSACIHGHSYRVELVVASNSLDKNGMVLDFAILNQFAAGIHQEWDHAMLLPPLIAQYYLGRPKVDKLVTTQGNPTAEWMAGEIGKRLMKLQDGQERWWVERVRVYETVNNWAEWSSARSAQ